MADSNTPEHQDRGLFGLFGKKKEEETHQQHGTAVEGHVVGVAPHEEGHVGESHPTPVSHGQVGVGEPYAAYGHVGEIHPAPVSHGHVDEGKFHGEVGEKKQEGGIMGKLHRSNSSSSSSSSDEEEDEKGEKKKKGGLRDKLKLRGRKKEGEEQGHVKAEEEGGEKKGLVEKIKEKIPGHHKEGE